MAKSYVCQGAPLESFFELGGNLPTSAAGRQRERETSNQLVGNIGPFSEITKNLKAFQTGWLLTRMRETMENGILITGAAEFHLFYLSSN